jgi:hypothetical protein
VDFNTGTRSGRPPRGPSGGVGFDYSDPLRSFLTTFPRVLFSPRAFFRDLSNRRGFANPLIFAAICILIGAVLSGVFNALAQGIPGMRLLATQTGLLWTVISGFIYGMVGLVIITGVYHLLVMLLAGPNRAGLEGTFRVVCYSFALQVLIWAPLLNILAGLYALYLCAFGFQAVHSTTYQRAAAIAALPILLTIPAAFLFGILAASLLSSV